ncbi:MAG: heme exporter protein D [Paracoccaceae bacterium]|jgi:heme exporter protein D
MPDLGQYASNVLGAYGVAILLLIALVGGSVMQARRTKAQLRELEARQKKHG